MSAREIIIRQDGCPEVGELLKAGRYITYCLLEFIGTPFPICCAGCDQSHGYTYHEDNKSYSENFKSLVEFVEFAHNIHSVHLKLVPPHGRYLFFRNFGFQIYN